MPPDSPRDLVLGRVRAALKGVTPPSAPAPVPVAARPGPGSLRDRFVASARLASAEVFVVDPERVRDAVADIVGREGVRRALVSPAAAEAPWACGTLDGIECLVRRDASPALEAIATADAGITTADFALADTGTLVVCASAREHRLDSLLPPVHIALLKSGAIVAGLTDLFERLSAEQRFLRHSAVTFIRGPSRTADIELTLTIGVHGPGRLYCVVMDDEHE